MIDRLYSRTLAIAAHRHAMAAMALISFAESSFLPLPPDFLLVPMTLARPRQAWLIAAVCTITSVVGGYVGYAIGFFLFDAIGRPLLEFYHAMDKYEAFKSAFAEWGAWIIVIKGLTPIPFKLVTIASGAARFDLVAFTLASLVSRSLRFFLIAALLWRFGDPIRDFIERRLMLVTSLAAAALVGGFVVLRYL
ncbi:MAG: DedA family protein [Alphaproteobacteria bacterium]|nr:DedA family protein [Alphaproteobacteria bacterium]